MTEPEHGQSSPLSGEEAFSEQQRETMKRRRELPAPAAAVSGLVAGGLYGTDGANLYLIDRATGVANLIGPHGQVEFAIGAITFDTGGVLYGISLTDAAQLYRIDVTTGAATAIGPLGIGFVFEGGLVFDGGGRLIESQPERRGRLAGLPDQHGDRCGHPHRPAQRTGPGHRRPHPRGRHDLRHRPAQQHTRAAGSRDRRVHGHRRATGDPVGDTAAVWHSARPTASCMRHS